jgi:hypothetical protein
MKAGNAFFIGLLSIGWLTSAEAAEVISREVAAQKVEIRNPQMQGNAISGEVINKSANPLRNLELLIQFHWLWKNEFQPGDGSPGKAFYVVIDKELRPGESAPFRAPLDAPPAARPDGYYMTEVTLAGFTEVIPPTAG